MSSWHLFKQHFMNNLVPEITGAFSKAWDFVNVEVTHMLKKIKPGDPPPLLRKQHTSTIQMISHYYKTGIVRHLTHCFSSKKKTDPVAGGNAPNSKGKSGIILPQPCFNVKACMYRSVLKMDLIIVFLTLLIMLSI